MKGIDFMKNDNNLVKVEDENGNVIDMIILKEFDYKNKKYAVLGEMDYCKYSDDDCDCEDECNCCCNDGDCKCENEELTLCLLEITKDENGSEIFKSIDDENLFNELVDEADKLMYED